MLRCSYDELIGVFQHEINHLLFGHVVASPEDYPDSEARIIAEEVTVNEWVVAPLPGRPLTLDQFPSLKPLEDTKTRYARLARKTADQGRNRPGGQATKNRLPGQKTDPAGQKSGPPGPKTGSSGQESGPPTPKSGPAGAESSEASPGIGGFAPLDNHDLWKDARENPVLGKLVIAAAVHEARAALDDSQWQALPDELRQRVEELAAGHSPGTGTENLLGTGVGGSIDWRQQLAASRSNRRTAPDVSSPSETDAGTYRDFSRPVPADRKTRRHGDHRHQRFDVLALLEIITAELKRLARDFQVMVVECDTVIQASYPYRAVLKWSTVAVGRIFGRLRGPVLAKIRPDVIIYFTDGDGPAPDRPPSMPVIWCLTPLGSRPVAWGCEIQMSGQ